MERRLAAIMATDVVGYSRMMGEDEVGTLARLNACRAELIDPTIAEFKGRMVKLMGDGMLVEFASVVDVVHAAVETQQTVTDHNADGPADKRIELRIGINLGDVAARLEDVIMRLADVVAEHKQTPIPEPVRRTMVIAPGQMFLA